VNRLLALVFSASMFFLALTGALLAAGETQLQAVLALRLTEGAREVPPKLVTEVVAQLQRTIHDIQVLSTTKSGGTKNAGRFVMVVSFAQEDRLKFEKMVVELPTATFSQPVRVESWNVNVRVESVGASEETTPAPFANFKLELDGRGSIAQARLRDVALRDILAYLARTARLQYLCPAEFAERTVSADLRNVSLDDFLKALKSALGIDVTRQGPIYIFCPAGTGRSRKAGSEE
jgi:hypothetical protein